MKEIGERYDEGGMVHILELTEYEYKTLCYLKDAVSGYERPDLFIGVPYSIDYEASNCFAAIRRWIKMRFELNAMQHSIDDLLKILDNQEDDGAEVVADE